MLGHAGDGVRVMMLYLCERLSGCLRPARREVVRMEIACQDLRFAAVQSDEIVCRSGKAPACLGMVHIAEMGGENRLPPCPERDRVFLLPAHG
jgi:hypothetical protein